jgi:hypothetical protein
MKLRNFERGAHATGVLPASPLFLVCVTVYHCVTVRFIQNNVGTTVFVLFGMFAMETCDNMYMSFTILVCRRNHLL